MSFIKSLVTILLLLLVFQVSAQSVKPSSVRYYPEYNSPLPVGSEEFLKNYDSLAGIEGVYVLLEYVYGSSEKNSIAIDSDLEDQIRDKLAAVGLKLLTEEQMKETPGMPEIAIYPSYTGGSIGRSIGPGAEIGTDSSSCGLEACCRNSVWMSFSQSARILRRPDSQFKLGTWGSGDDSNLCHNRGEWMYGAVLSVFDQFIADFKKAETEKKPIKVASESELPSNCAQSWGLHMQLFDTNSTTPNQVFLPILRELAVQSVRCSNYSYLIETHADARANEDYNKLLTEARASSIKEFLMSRGVAYHRLKSKAHGEENLLSTGTTEADHAVNRRVVITPILTDNIAGLSD